MVYELSYTGKINSPAMTYILGWIKRNPIIDVESNNFGLSLNPYHELNSMDKSVDIPKECISINENNEIDITHNDEIISLAVVGQYTV